MHAPYKHISTSICKIISVTGTAYTLVLPQKYVIMTLLLSVNHTYDYKKNPESPVGNELDVNEGDTLVYLMPNEDNEHWWLVEDVRDRWAMCQRPI